MNPLPAKPTHCRPSRERACAFGNKMKTTLDLWCARNLGILSILGLVGVTMVCGPLLLFLVVSGPLYIITGIGYMSFFQAVSQITACMISTALFFYGMFLVMQYFRYPKIGFGLSKRVFWLSSLLFCPAWILPIVLTLDWPLRLPPEEYWTDFMHWIVIAVTLIILPLSHFIFSAIALIYINKTAEPSAPLNDWGSVALDVYL